MKVRNLLKDRFPPIYRIAPDQTMDEAVSMMMMHRIGALIVMEEGGIKGIVTERDVMATVGLRSMSLSKVLVRDAMSSNLVVCQADDSLDQIMELLFNNDTGHRIRHLPVMDEGKLVGVISIADIVLALLTETRFENRLLKNYIKNWPDDN